MSNKKNNLTKQEFQHLANKVNNNTLCVEYFRKSLFNTSFRGSRKLDRKKTIYKDKNITIKVDRSLNQKHRDLLSLLMYEEKSKIAKDGSYYIKTSLYGLAKKMGYKYPSKATNYIEDFIDDMRNTDILIKQGTIKYKHMFIGSSYYNEEEDIYIVEIPAETAKYHIYSTGVSIPQSYNEKIVAIPNNKSRLKALISFMLSNAKLENGIFFETVCDKLDLIERTAKSKFKKQISENEELLKEFKIKFEDDKFYLKKEKCIFYPALSEKQTISFEKNEKSKKFDKKLADVMSHKEDNNIIIYQYKQPDDTEIKIKFHDEKPAFFKNNEFIRQLTDDEIRTMILKLMEI